MTLQPTEPVSRHADFGRPAQLRGLAKFRPAAALYLLSLRQHRHGKRWLIMLVLMLTPAMIAILSRLTDSGLPATVLEFNLAFMFIPQGLLPLLALVYASGVLHDEQEEQTITYLLMRPLARWTIYLAKLAAAITAAVILAVFSILVTYAAIFAGAPSHGALMRCLDACLIHTLAVVAYCCLFGLMGLLTRRVLIAGIIYIALVEGLLANIPFAIRLITVIYYTRLIAYRTLPFVANAGYRVHDLAAETWQFNTLNDPKLQNYPHSWLCVLVLLSGAVICSLLAAFMCTNREFYVKTPEKT